MERRRRRRSSRGRRARRTIRRRHLFSANEAGASFECRVDTAPFAACTSPRTTETLSDGAHRFDVRAIDQAGNVDPAPATRSFTVDTAAPATSIESGPTGTTNDSTPTFAFAANEAGASFECRVDTAPFAACTSLGSAHVRTPVTHRLLVCRLLL